MKKFWIVLSALCLLMTLVMGAVSVSAADKIAYGDVDGNGRINNRDLGILQQYLNEWDVDVDLDVCDVDGNGRVNNRDLGILQQYLNEWDVTLGPEEPEDDENVFNDTELEWN